MRIAFVVPRYGPEIVGGAETLARAFAEHLPRDRYEVDVLTTCARNHHTWKNELPAGSSREGRCVVRRFPVSPRDVEGFLEVQGRMSMGLPLELEDELRWVAGSVNSEELYGFLDVEGDGYEALLFLPYLFGTTLLGTHVRPERSILVPCLHDEPFARTAVVAGLFADVRGLVFNSAPERALAERLYGIGEDWPVVGMGFDPVDPPADPTAFARRHELEAPYLLYFGRKEEGKNLPLLLDAFRRCDEAGLAVSLVVAGDGVIPAEKRLPGLVDLPRLSEQEKREACAGALAVCQPSTNESFSIVLMEAWLEGVPALVHEACDVTRDHVVRSGGGLYFANAEDLVAETEWLLGHREEARDLGAAGRAWVRSEYGWPRVIERFDRAIEALTGDAAWPRATGSA